jgi:hypothetical protein
MMTEFDLAAPLNDDQEELAASITAIRTFSIYSQTALFFALLERRAIGADKVFAFNRLNAAIFRQTAATAKEVATTKEARVAARSHALIAAMLDEFEATIRNMATLPPGAGKA